MTVGILGLGLIGGSLARAYSLSGHTVLAAEANVCLLTGAPKEVCPLGLTPTTSTTVMTVMGDLLVVGTMKRIHARYRHIPNSPATLASDGLPHGHGLYGNWGRNK